MNSLEARSRNEQKQIRFASSMDEIHIWQLNQESIFVFLPDELRTKLFNEAHALIGGSRDYFFRVLYASANARGINRVFSPGTMRQIAGGKRSTPLWVLIGLCQLVSGSLNEDNCVSREVEKQVITYRDGERGKNIVGKFPILVSPEFNSIVGHLLGDGTFGGKGKTANYCQKNELGRKRFLEKMRNVFGEFEVNQRAYNGFHVLIPKPIVDIVRNYYGIVETNCLRRRLPNKFKFATIQGRLAVLTAFIVDEGHVGDSIEICIGNKALLEDFRKLTLSLGYKCSQLTSRAGHKSLNNLFRFRISLKSATKLLNDIKELSKSFPTCDLAQKQKRLELITKRQATNNPKTPNGLTKNKIVELIASGVTTTTFLKENLCLSGSTITEHLRYLKNKNRIRQVGKSGSTRLWAVNPPTTSLKAQQ